MGRVKLSLPDEFCYLTVIPVRITDLNYGNHLANDKLLGIIHEARVRFFSSFNCSEMDIFGNGIIQSDSVIIYKGQAFYGDSLSIQIGVADIHKYGCDIYYKISNVYSKSIIAEAKTGILFFDYEKQKIALTPFEFVEKFKK